MFRVVVLFFFFLPLFAFRVPEAKELEFVSDLQKTQLEFDDQYFEINEGFEKTRHIFLHLAKTTGKMATYCEAMEHGKDTDSAILINEVLPDLLIHALQIANQYDVNLTEKYEERIRFIINRAESAKK